MNRSIVPVLAAAALSLAGIAMAADAPPANPPASPPAQSSPPAPGARPMGPGMGMGQGGAGGMQGSQHMHGMMMQHMNRMQQMQMTGNVDRDFAQMMIRHHEGAIAMSKMQIEQGKDEALKKQARKIISDSEKDIQVLAAAVARLQ